MKKVVWIALQALTKKFARLHRPSWAGDLGLLFGVP